MPAFDPARGSIGAFAGIVLRNQSSRIAIRHHRQRRAQNGSLLSLAVPLAGTREPVGDTLTEDDGLAAWYGQTCCAAAVSLQGYAGRAMETGRQIGDALVSAFRGAEDALLTLVTKGKVDFRDLANSILEDITRIALRSAVLGPLANWLGGALGGIGGGIGGSVTAAVAHSGGVIGVSALPQRQVPAMAFAEAQRFHAGGYPGLRPDEVPAILQRGERVQSRREVAEAQRGGGGSGGGGVTINMSITTPDADSLPPQRRGPPHHHDAGYVRVHPPVPHPRAPQRSAPHSPLWLLRERQPCGQYREDQATARGQSARSSAHQ